MTQTHTVENVTIGLRLADAVSSGDGATVRTISSEFSPEFIQKNGSHIYLSTFLLLNQMAKEDFPNDVWGAIPGFLSNDIPDRAVMLGCSEELLTGMVGSFLKQNAWAVFHNEEPRVLNADAYSGGYFHVTAAIGEAVWGLIKVTADIRMGGDVKKTAKLIDDVLVLQAHAEAEAASDAA